MERNEPTQAQRAILDALKRRGTATVSRLAEAVELNRETVREHLKGLETGRYVARAALARGGGRGRPEVVYGLGPGAERLYPRREGEVLRGLAEHLSEAGKDDVLASFLREYMEGRLARGLARVEGLEGRARLEAAVEVLREDGFMPELRETARGPELALCHCPIRDLVRATRLPCRLEVGYVRALLGEVALARTAYIPAGDGSCSYAVGGSEGGLG